MRRMVTGRRRSLIPRRRYLPYIILAGLALFSLMPLVFLVFNAFKTSAEIGANPLGPPSLLHWSNFVDAWDRGHIGRGLANTAILVVGSVVGVWIAAGFAGYALARLRVPGSGGFLLFLFLLTALPVQIYVVPLFFLWAGIGLYDTLLGLIVIHVALSTPLCTLLLRSYLLKVPPDFEEAARVDGAGEFTVMWHIVLPLAWPGLVTIALIAGLGAYNDLFFPSIFIQTDTLQPVSTTFLAFVRGFQRDAGLTGAAGVIVVLPIFVAFMLMQRRFVEGLTTGGLRG